MAEQITTVAQAKRALREMKWTPPFMNDDDTAVFSQQVEGPHLVGIEVYHMLGKRWEQRRRAAFVALVSAARAVQEAEG
jgi:hypothetical protein